MKRFYLSIINSCRSNNVLQTLVAEIVIFILLLCSSVGCTPSHKNTDTEYHFKQTILLMDKAMPTITMQVGNTAQARFIVDTGSDNTIIAKNFYTQHPNQFGIIDKDIIRINTLNTIRTDSVYITTTTIGSYQHTVYVMDLYDFEQTMFGYTGKVINGIIGRDFLYLHNAKIDFDSLTVTFK